MPTSIPTPIRAKPSERDPLRNFKFTVDFLAVDNGNIAQALASIGFISVSGIGIQTDVIPYREGGDNTTTRKLPGQSNVGPLTLVSGVFLRAVNPQIEWFKQIFSVQWGQGNAAFNDDFRCDIIVNVLKHPVTKFSTGGEGDPNSQLSAGMSVRFLQRMAVGGGVQRLERWRQQHHDHQHASGTRGVRAGIRCERPEPGLVTGREEN
jgi:phage tail-like protein